MEINCIIVDDEQYARKLLDGYAAKLPGLNVKALCRNSMEALNVLQKEKIDLMFLDIQMPDLSGVDLLKTLKNKPFVIFTTAYQEYAIEGYTLDVIDYMLKPISFDRFVQGVNKATDHLLLKKKAEENGTAKILKQSVIPEKDYINLKADYKIYKVKYQDIFYVEGLKEYVTFYTASRKYIVLESLKNLENKLPAEQFMRVHKSYIVNTTKIESLYGNMIEIGGQEIPIGKSYAGTVKKNLFSL
ncbi:MAG: LytTR family DNA-binding domain-containing protein [Bacteroidales bacterium]|nr:LytTR family DNA-binding domain-containing protein [Bacteroidales bacterium]